jgi:ABC-type sugar transport system permease subunit
MKLKEFLAFVAPSYSIMILLMVVPLGMTIYLGFTNFTYGATPRWVGLDNYISVLTDARFWNSLKFTLVIVFTSIPIRLVLGFIIALMLNEVRRTWLKDTYISGFMIPFIVVPVVGTLVFSWLFKDTWGLFSWLLGEAGINISWYSQPLAARALVIGHWVWMGTAFPILVLYAGLQAMPDDFIEAAIVDGATWLQRIFLIIIPHLRSLFLLVIMISVMDTYRLFDSVFVMTGGGPGSATETVMLYTYRISFQRLSLGKGSAINLLTVVGVLILMIPTLYQTYKDQTEA